jgi:hypothetical protein
MKYYLLILISLVSINLVSQSFTIQDNNMSLSGQPSANDFSKNTYLMGLSSDSLSWSIVVDSMPSAWEFSNCFPNCYNVGVTNGELVISNGQSYYLNCHIYPNNTAGEGIIKMEITNGAGTTELVTWHGMAGNVGMVNNYFNKKDNIKSIYNLSGQVVKEFTPNQIYIVQLKDGSFLKTFVNN